MRPVRLVALLLFSALPGARDVAACVKSCAEPVRACRQAECSALRGRARHRCVRACRARSTCSSPGAAIRTLAYVAVECRSDPQGFLSGRLRLLVRRGNCDPVTVMELGLAPVPDPSRLCRAYGSDRYGPGASLVGGFRRMAVLPDASGAVFEVTNDHPLYPDYSPDLPEEGIFFVRADGKGLRRLGPALRVPIFVQVAGAVLFREPAFATSPDSRTLAFTDLDDRDTRQIFTLDIRNGRRRQLTHLPAGGLPEDPYTCCPSFIDERTVLFSTVVAGPSEDGSLYRIRTNGRGLKTISSVTALPGSVVDPEFQIASGGTNVVTVELPRLAENPVGRLMNVREQFVIDGERVLQLTDFGRRDTAAGLLRNRRAFFRASTNRLRTNPSENCQLFSVNTLGGDLRQLTRFREDGRGSVGCFFAAGAACSIGTIMPDPMTGALLFGSSCDPLGMNPYGFQLFSMRPDGSGLRQLTATPGMVIESDGTVRVETTGPFASAIP